MSASPPTIDARTPDWLGALLGRLAAQWPRALRTLDRRTLPIGLDLGACSARLLQLRLSDAGPPTVIASARRDLARASVRDPARDPTGEPARRGGSWEQAGPAVKAALREVPFIGRRVVVSLPREMAQYKTVRLPASQKPTETVRTLADEAKAAFGIDATDPAYAAHFLPGEPLRRTDWREGLLAVVRRADVERFVCCVHDWGLEVEAVDLEPMAIYRGVERFGRRERDRKDATVLVDIGSRATRVVIGRGATISFFKTLPIGGQAVHAAVAAALGLSTEEADLLSRREESAGAPAGRGDVVGRAIANAMRLVVEDLARELALCLRYYAVTFRGRPPRRVRVGGGAATPAFVEALATAMQATLPVSVEARRPMADLVATAEADGAEWSNALGLALRRAPSGQSAAVAGATRREQAEADVEDAEQESLGEALKLPIEIEEVAA